MANKRIKDLTQTATTLANDDYVAIDGSSNGTRKIVKGDLVNDISSQVAGTYLDEANNLSDVASLDTSKLNLEVPDVGTAPNEVPMNGMLGDMAFQSAEGISVARAEVESTTGTATTQALTVTDGSSTKFVVQEDGSVGIGTDSPSSYDGIADDLVVGNSSSATASGVTIATVGGGVGSIYYADGTAIPARYAGYVQYNHGSNSLLLGTNGATRWTINSTGNLVAGSGLGIDFGSAATSAGQGTGTTGSVSNSVLSDYEFGTWTPTYKISNTDFAALTMDVLAAQYCKVGRHVHCQAYIRTDNVDATGALGYLTISGLPFVADSTGINYGGASVHNSASWTNAPTTAYVAPNSAVIYLKRYGTTGTSTLTASDLVTGAVANQNEIIFTVSYIAST